MKQPKKPRLLKKPKTPKITASKNTWDNFEQKMKAINAENKKREDAYNKELTAFKKEKERRMKIKNLK